MKIRRSFALLMVVILVFTMDFGVLGWKAEAANGPDVCSPVYVVMNAETGQLICEKNMTLQCYPASITKIMTALVVFDHITDRQLDDQLKFSYDAAVANINLRSSTLKPTAKEGEVMTVNDALHGMIMPSGNECANALAEYVAGSNEAFVAMMNDKVAELGLTDSHFMNPSGLDDDNQYVTAYDMAVIMRAAIQIPKCKELLGCKTYTIPATNMAEARSLKAGHGYVGGDWTYEGEICGKGGKTDLAKRTLVTCVKKDDIELIAVVLKDEESRAYPDTQVILDFAFDYLQGKVTEVVWEPDGDEYWPKTSAILYEYTNTCCIPVAALDSNTKVTCNARWGDWLFVDYLGMNCFAVAEEWTNGKEPTATPTPPPTTEAKDNPFYQDVTGFGDQETARYEVEDQSEKEAYLQVVGLDTTPRGPFAVMWLFFAMGAIAILAGLATLASYVVSLKNSKRRKMRR